ncbi:MAG TPA: ATP-grasp domain-containing protein [Stellaceae bacterium]|jgi:biotin carboxylase|nr:ATP-grasp domain-containing protein [Stellaceae bacterium]
MNLLLLGFAFVLPYHVMRCAAAAGHRVVVLGNGPALDLVGSRYCDGFVESAFDYRSQDYEILAEEITGLAISHDFDLVIPSDDVSTRALAAIKDQLPIRTTPLPDVATFDTLNDKWNFARCCEDHGVRVPATRRYENAAALRRDLTAGAIALPLTVKPTNWSGGVGVMHIRTAHELALLDAVDYRPVLAQQHIRGETVGVSVLCTGGKLTAHIVQQRTSRYFRVLDNPDLVANVARLMAALGFDGVANFDAVVDRESGLGYLVECNPRLWYSVFPTMIAGLNFVAAAIDSAAGAPIARRTLPPIEIKLYTAGFRSLATPWRLSRTDWRMLCYHLRDPAPFLHEHFQRFDDSDVAVRAMGDYIPLAAEAERRAS